MKGVGDEKVGEREKGFGEVMGKGLKGKDEGMGFGRWKGVESGGWAKGQYW